MAKKIKINGPIISDGNKWIYNLFGIPATCAADVNKVIDEIKDNDPDQDLELYINSGGGSVSAGSEIYTVLRKHQEKTKCTIHGYITGMAASAASVIAMACNILEISPTGEVMIHNASTGAYGDHRLMSNASDMLKSVDEGICNAYILKTGMSREDLLDLMGKTTWMNAQQALKMKFVDKIMFDEGNQLVASASIGDVIPQQVIDKMRALFVTGNLNTEAISKDSIPGMGNYTPTINKEGDGPMDLQELLGKLSDDQKKVVQDAINAAIAAAKNEAMAAAEAAFAEEKQKLQDTIDGLRNAAPMKSESEEDILANVDPKIKAIVEAARVNEAAAKAKLEAMEEANELARFEKLAASYTKLPIDAKVFGPIFRNFAKADEKGFEQLEALLKASDNCIAAGKVFEVKGSDGQDTADMSAWETIQLKVKEALTANSTLSYQEALTNVFKAEPELYNRYKDEMRSGEVVSDEE
jgi:ATP-dependent Clp protease protease subunit